MLLAKNSTCSWHRDKHNVGYSYITCLGNYNEAAGRQHGGGKQAPEDVAARDFRGGVLLMNPTKIPLWECLDCHLRLKGKRHCRIDQRHTGDDWLNVVWNRMKSGEHSLGPGFRTKQATVRGKDLAEGKRMAAAATAIAVQHHARPRAATTATSSVVTGTALAQVSLPSLPATRRRAKTIQARTRRRAC
jgi:hypothetical protein